MRPGPFADLINDDLGTVTFRDDGFFDVVFERRIKRPVEKVWAALTVPERIADWFTTVDIELRVGGRYHLRFEDQGYAVDGVVVELEPPRLLAHTWPGPGEDPDSVIRYELAPDGDGCRLTFTQTGLPPMFFGAVAGWHTFLEALPGAADGIRTTWTAERETEVGERYAHLKPAGA